MADWNTTTLPILGMNGSHGDDTLVSTFEGDSKQLRQRNPSRLRTIVVQPAPTLTKTQLTAYKSFFDTYGTYTYFSITNVDDSTDYNVRFTAPLNYVQTNPYPEYYAMDPIVLEVKGAA